MGFSHVISQVEIPQPRPQAYTRYASEPSYQPEAWGRARSTGDVIFDYRQGRLRPRTRLEVPLTFLQSARDLYFIWKPEQSSP